MLGIGSHEHEVTTSFRNTTLFHTLDDICPVVDLGLIYCDLSRLSMLATNFFLGGGIR